MNLSFTQGVSLECRRCEDCNRWFGAEMAHLWCCGQCQKTRANELAAELATQLRANAALRGALKSRKLVK